MEIGSIGSIILIAIVFLIGFYLVVVSFSQKKGRFFAVLTIFGASLFIFNPYRPYSPDGKPLTKFQKAIYTPNRTQDDVRNSLHESFKLFLSGATKRIETPFTKETVGSLVKEKMRSSYYYPEILTEEENTYLNKIIDAIYTQAVDKTKKTTYYTPSSLYLDIYDSQINEWNYFIDTYVDNHFYDIVVYYLKRSFWFYIFSFTVLLLFIVLLFRYYLKKPTQPLPAAESQEYIPHSERLATTLNTQTKDDPDIHTANEPDKAVVIEKIKINKADEKELSEEIGITILQAKFLVKERDKTGGFKDYDDFLNRSKLNNKNIENIKDKLDFSGYVPQKQQGRVIDFD